MEVQAGKIYPGFRKEIPLSDWKNSKDALFAVFSEFIPIFDQRDRTELEKFYDDLGIGDEIERTFPATLKLRLRGRSSRDSVQIHIVDRRGHFRSEESERLCELLNVGETITTEYVAFHSLPSLFGLWQLRGVRKWLNGLGYEYTSGDLAKDLVVSRSSTLKFTYIHFGEFPLERFPGITKLFLALYVPDEEEEYHLALDWQVKALFGNVIVSNGKQPLIGLTTNDRKICEDFISF